MITKHTIQEKLRNHLISKNSTFRINWGDFEITSTFQIIIKFSILVADEYKGEIILNRRQIESILEEDEFSKLLEILQEEIRGYC